MIKNISQLTQTINGRSYQFTCDMDSPLTDVKEAFFQFQKVIGQIEDNTRKLEEEKKVTKISSMDEQAKEKE